MAFNQQKQERLHHIDLSRKGSIDEYIVETVNCINLMSNYFTTSSCSGRIIILESAETKKSSTASKSVPNSRVMKKGCKWLLASHKRINVEEIEEALLSVTNEAVFKFEPMIMHIQCQSLQDAQSLHQAAVASGFRNSGISVGIKGKIVTAVRSTHGLEVPLSLDGVILVSKQYLSFLVDCANQKMEENLTRINRFAEEVKLIANNINNSSSSCNFVQPDKKKSGFKAARTVTNTDDTSCRNDQGGSPQEKNKDFFDQDLSLFVFENT